MASSLWLNNISDNTRVTMNFLRIFISLKYYFDSDLPWSMRELKCIFISDAILQRVNLEMALFPQLRIIPTFQWMEVGVCGVRSVFVQQHVVNK